MCRLLVDHHPRVKEPVDAKPASPSGNEDVGVGITHDDRAVLRECSVAAADRLATRVRPEHRAGLDGSTGVWNVFPGVAEATVELDIERLDERPDVIWGCGELPVVQLEHPADVDEEVSRLVLLETEERAQYVVRLRVLGVSLEQVALEVLDGMILAIGDASLFELPRDGVAEDRHASHGPEILGEAPSDTVARFGETEVAGSGERSLRHRELSLGEAGDHLDVRASREDDVQRSRDGRDVVAAQRLRVEALDGNAAQGEQHREYDC